MQTELEVRTTIPLCTLSFFSRSSDSLSHSNNTDSLADAVILTKYEAMLELVDILLDNRNMEQLFKLNKPLIEQAWRSITFMLISTRLMKFKVWDYESSLNSESLWGWWHKGNASLNSGQYPTVVDNGSNPLQFMMVLPWGSSMWLSFTRALLRVNFWVAKPDDRASSKVNDKNWLFV